MRVLKSLTTKRGQICLGLLVAILLSGATNLTVSSAGRVTYAVGITNVRMSQLVGPGYRLRTGLNGRVELTFANGYKLRVGPSSDLQLVAYRPVQKQTLLYLNQGKVWNNVKPGVNNRVVTRTKYSTASVMGTIFDTQLGGLSSKTTVIHGSVGVHADEDQPVENLFDHLPPLPAAQPTLPSAAPASPTAFKPPTQVNNPVHQIDLPLRVVPGPVQVSREQWLQIVENQQILMGPDGKAQVTTVDPVQLQANDEWYRWNRQMDAQAGQQE